MDLSANPFAVLTFIVAPAVLTNASSVMGLQTSNRFARAIDRARFLISQIEGKEGAINDLEIRLRLRQIDFAERRVLYLVRAMTAYYSAVGAFAGASFASLLGAVFYIADMVVCRNITLAFAFGCGFVGIGGLLLGSALLVWETRQTLAILSEETAFLRESRSRRLLQPGDITKNLE